MFGHTSEGRFSGGFVFTVVAKMIKVSNRCENMDLSVPPKHDFISLSFDFSWVLRWHLTTMIRFFWIHLWKNMIVRLVWNGPSLVFILEWPLHSSSIQWIRRHSDNFVDLHEYFKGHFNRNNWEPIFQVLYYNFGHHCIIVKVYKRPIEKPCFPSKLILIHTLPGSGCPTPGQYIVSITMSLPPCYHPFWPNSVSLCY